MTFNELKDTVGEVSKDTKINLGSLLKPGGTPGLSDNQIFATALACGYATKDADLVSALLDAGVGHLSDGEKEATKTAAVMMAMNNVYYRFLHLVENPEYGRLQAKLRMTAIGNPGVDKVDFELYSLAISALSGCGMCINAHENVLKKANISTEGVQSAVRIAAVVNAAAQALSLRRMS